jgi:hypothetical protein
LNVCGYNYIFDLLRQNIFNRKTQSNSILIQCKVITLDNSQPHLVHLTTMGETKLILTYPALVTM